MYLLRRTTLRVFNSPSSTILSQSRSIKTSARSTFHVGRQTTSLTLQRRFASDDVRKSDEDLETDQDESKSTLSSTISSATSEVASQASSAANTIGDYAQAARDSVSDAEGEHSATARPIVKEATPSKSLYVGNLFFDVTEEDLRAEMERHGVVTGLKIIYDNRGLSKGFGYVEYDSADSAAQALASMNQQIFQGRRLTVQYVLGRPGRPAASASRNPPSKTLFIGNMSFDMSDKDLNDLFREVRNVLDVRVAIDRRSGQPRGFAHADFIDTESAAKAFEFLNDKEVNGRRLRVDYSGKAGPPTAAQMSGGTNQ